MNIIDDIKVNFHFGGGVSAKETFIPANVTMLQHVHVYDHLSVLASGEVELNADGVRTKHIAPACLLIKAGVNHEIYALTDSVWYCIHAEDYEALVKDHEPKD